MYEYFWFSKITKIPPFKSLAYTLYSSNIWTFQIKKTLCRGITSRGIFWWPWSFYTSQCLTQTWFRHHGFVVVHICMPLACHKQALHSLIMYKYGSTASSGILLHSFIVFTCNNSFFFIFHRHSLSLCLQKNWEVMVSESFIIHMYLQLICIAFQFGGPHQF